MFPPQQVAYFYKSPRAEGRQKKGKHTHAKSQTHKHTNTHFSTVIVHLEVLRIVLSRSPWRPTTIPTTRFSLGINRTTVMAC